MDMVALVKSILYPGQHYVCECGFRFDKPDEGEEIMGECHGVPIYRDYMRCPACGSPEIERITKEKDYE